MILIIDNYDSFTHNLVHYIEQMDETVCLFQHDQINLEQIRNLHPKAILLSPGPNTPEQAGISVACILEFYQKIPIIGICLGLQCLVYAFGGSIVKATRVYHGKNSFIRHNQTGLFRKLPNKFSVTRYHSLAADERTLPSCLEISARSIDDNCIMAISHRSLPIYGVQFHPEAILTQYGYQLLEQFIHDINESLIRTPD